MNNTHPHTSPIIKAKKVTLVRINYFKRYFDGIRMICMCTFQKKIVFQNWPWGKCPKTVISKMAATKSCFPNISNCLRGISVILVYKLMFIRARNPTNYMLTVYTYYLYYYIQNGRQYCS